MSEIETNIIENTSENERENYPSSELVLDVCIQDYERIQENYNKIYEKINFALAFAGIVLTIMLGTFDFTTAKLIVKDIHTGELLLILLELLCHIGSLALVICATIWLLILLRGRTVAVFKSEDARDEQLFKEKKENTAVWLIDKYTRIVSEMRSIVSNKQKSFDRALITLIIGIILYAISIVLRKGGF